jgi:hypothetical protein
MSGRISEFIICVIFTVLGGLVSGGVSCFATIIGLRKQIKDKGRSYNDILLVLPLLIN